MNLKIYLTDSMKSKEDNFSTVFSKNRAEELGYDVWKYFVIPPYFDKLDLRDATKPRVIIGGRGCGKTMLLRYLSHQSTFSRNRNDIDENATSHIGLYWKVDTQFANAMTKRNIPNDKWESAFNHFTALIISIEILNSLASIVNSKSNYITKEELYALNFGELKYFHKELELKYEDLLKYLEGNLWAFVSWVNDVKQKEPDFLAGVAFIKALIKIITTKIESLNNANFFIYIDEFENLVDYQKKIINTWLKHSEKPLIFNLAVKKNVLNNQDTVGSEMISDIHDYRTIDLETYLLDGEFEIFSAEILLLKLTLSKIFNSPIDINSLRDPSGLEIRRGSEYKDTILATAKELFPDVSQHELAVLAFKDKILSKKIFERIQKALNYRGSKINVKSFFKIKFPEATIIVPSLLYRNRLSVNEIYKEFQKLEKGEENRFTGKTNWIHNNFIDCLLQIYAPYSRSCPFYSGFKTFCLLAHGNIRHFLELCYKSMNRVFLPEASIHFPIEPIQQAIGASQASASLLSEIRSFGKFGNKMHTFVLRLGSVFELARERSGKNVSEQTHFSINKGKYNLTNEDDEFLTETLKHSVLYETKATKTKNKIDPETEYVLNPIYSPYFHISYRKKRKLEISTNELITLIRGSIDEFKKLTKNLQKEWIVDEENSLPTLFSLVMQENENYTSRS